MNPTNCTCTSCGREFFNRRGDSYGVCRRCLQGPHREDGSVNKQTASEIDEQPASYGDSTMDTRTHREDEA